VYLLAWELIVIQVKDYEAKYEKYKEKEMKIEEFFKKVNVQIPEHLKDNYDHNKDIESVTQNGWAIQYIENPSEEIKKIAVAQNGFAIMYIKNPSEEIKKIAVTQNGLVIRYIENPSEEIKKIAVNQDGYAIGYIDNPSEEVMELAVKQNKDAVIYFKKEWFE